MKDALKYYIALFGEPVGIALALMVILWDFFMKGSRCFMEYAIGWQGTIILVVAMVLIIASKHFRKTF